MSATERKCETCRHYRGEGDCSNPDVCYVGTLSAWEQRADAPAAAQEPAGAANARQVGGSHYKKAIQPWDYIAANGIGYFEGNVIKYVSRWKDKAGVEDLKKARHYLDKLIELQGDGE